jgi:hypothetical protein
MFSFIYRLRIRKRRCRFHILRCRLFYFNLNFTLPRVVYQFTRYITSKLHFTLHPSKSIFIFIDLDYKDTLLWRAFIKPSV